jgi:hypothetical protein
LIDPGKVFLLNFFLNEIGISSQDAKKAFKKYKPGKDYKTFNFKELELIQQTHNQILIPKQLIMLNLGEFKFESSSHSLQQMKPKTSGKVSKPDQWFERFPPQLFPSINFKTWNEFFDSYFDQVKKAINENKFDLYAKMSKGLVAKESILAFQYIFKSIEFMFERNFITRERIINLFQDDNVLKTFSLYYYYGNKRELTRYMGSSPTNYTGQWYWKFGFKFFQSKFFQLVTSCCHCFLLLVAIHTSLILIPNNFSSPQPKK